MDDIKPLIYIIEDEESISKLIEMYLKKSEMKTKIFETAEDALSSLSSSKLPDLIILDLNLPRMSGFDFLKEFRKLYNNQIPVLIVSARDTDDDVIQGLGLGGDEFVTKPFSPRVLVARVKANLRRISNANTPEDCIKFGDFTLLLNSCVLKKNGIKIPLSSKEYDVLEFLLKNAGQVLSPELIYDKIWKVKFGDLTAVAVYIQRLRKKLEQDSGNSEFIITEFGKGYIFKKEYIKQ